MGFIKIKNLLSLKDIIKQTKRKVTDWGKMSGKCRSKENFLSKISKKLSEHNNKTTEF